MAAMSALGVLPPVDVAIHADTGWERAETYAFAKKWTPWLKERGVQVITVMAAEKRRNPFYSVNKPSTFLPAFTTHENGKMSGMLRRQCTSEWKVVPVRHWLQANRQGQHVEQWLGFTWDEAYRSTLRSNVKYITNVYPLIEILDQPYTRSMVIKWLIENDLEVPVKSSCIFCPYHHRTCWREIQLSGNGDWEKALGIDRILRNRRPGYLCYLTAERKPLDECDFRSQEDLGQLRLQGV